MKITQLAAVPMKSQFTGFFCAVMLVVLTGCAEETQYRVAADSIIETADSGERITIGEGGSVTVESREGDDGFWLPEMEAKAKIVAVGEPNHGEAKVKNGTVTYRSDPGYEGSDAFRYRAEWNGEQDAGKVNVEVIGEVTEDPYEEPPPSEEIPDPDVDRPDDDDDGCWKKWKPRCW